MFLGYRLRELRKDKNLSQEDLGKILGVTKVSISGYEKGTRLPSMDVLNGILDVFMVPADYLLGRELNLVWQMQKLRVRKSAILRQQRRPFQTYFIRSIPYIKTEVSILQIWLDFANAAVLRFISI